MRTIDRTHDAAASSWLGSANTPGTDFPIQNLPFAVFRRAGSREMPRGGVAIGDEVLDLAALSRTSASKAWRCEPRSPAPHRCSTTSSPWGPWHGAHCGARSSTSCTRARSPLRRRTSRRSEAAWFRNPRWSTRFPSGSATTRTSTRRSTTHERSAVCWTRRARYPGTSNGCPLRTTGGCLPSGSRGRSSGGRMARRCGTEAPRPNTDLPGASTTNSSSASMSARAMRWASALRFRAPRTTSSAFRCSTTGQRGISRPGRWRLSDRSMQRTSPPRSRPGSSRWTH